MPETPVSSLSNSPGGGLVVAVDGPSGTGKSSTCRTLAETLHAKYLDTGAMYRVATLATLRAGVDVFDTPEVIRVTSHLPLEITDDPHSAAVLLGGEDVSAVIRGPEVTSAVSAVSAIPEVRQNLVELQRHLSRDAHRVIVEGRDIGTVVLADAPVKIYMTARPEVRAQRRHAQNIEAGVDSRLEDVLADVLRRDEADSSRETSPLRPAEDAVIVDTSEMTQSEVLGHLIEIIRQSAKEA